MTDDMTEPSNPPLALVPGLTDADIAEDLKKRLVEAYGPVLALSDEANRKGFTLHIQSGMGPLGKHVITLLKVLKEF
jgi:hypothetical protein